LKVSVMDRFEDPTSLCPNSAHVVAVF